MCIRDRCKEDTKNRQVESHERSEKESKNTVREECGKSREHDTREEYGKHCVTKAHEEYKKRCMSVTREEYDNSRDAKKPLIGCCGGVGELREVVRRSASEERHAPRLRRIRRGRVNTGRPSERRPRQSIGSTRAVWRAGRRRHNSRAPPTVAWRRCVEGIKGSQESPSAPHRRGRKSRQLTIRRRI